MTFGVLIPGALLEFPMSEFVAHLPIRDRMKAALCRAPDHEFLLLLGLAQCFEEARWVPAEAGTDKGFGSISGINPLGRGTDPAPNMN
jgi:c-di-GMP-related signal transduction protein